MGLDLGLGFGFGHLVVRDRVGGGDELVFLNPPSSFMRNLTYFPFTPRWHYRSCRHRLMITVTLRTYIYYSYRSILNYPRPLLPHSSPNLFELSGTSAI